MFDPTDLLRGPEGWLLVVLVANVAIVLVAQALLVAGLGSGFGFGRDPDDGVASERRTDADADAGDADVPPGRMRCPNCRAENGTDYRYCRECLAELPGRGRGPAGGTDARRRPLP